MLVKSDMFLSDKGYFLSEKVKCYKGQTKGFLSGKVHCTGKGVGQKEIFVGKKRIEVGQKVIFVGKMRIEVGQKVIFVGKTGYGTAKGSDKRDKC